MGGLGYLAGGLATGLGQSLVQKAAFDMKSEQETRLEAMRERREIALEDLRSKNRMAEQTHEGQVQVATAKQKLTDAEPFEVLKDQRETARQLKLEGARASSQKELARLQASLSRSNDRASRLLQQQIDSGELQSFITSGDGYIYGVFRDGSRMHTGIPAVATAKNVTEDPITGKRTTTHGDSKPTIAPGNRIGPGASPSVQNGYRGYKAASADPKPGKIAPGQRPPLSSFQR